ncbi:MAG: hypothetical protein IPM91_22395 [Bacteroidetes bacterium]|nr:hypothetical protein [Bacteroidota bacterium]
MSENRPASEAAFQLFRLPKERPVLDYVLQKLGEGASPERHELLEALLNMYRTSTGFDPFAMSKARFKRLKAAEFRQTLMEIDHEIGLLLQSTEYKKQITRQSDYAPLFAAYLELAESIQLHPPLSLTDELEDFENKCETHEAEELILTLYRQQSAFLEEVYRREGPEGFLKKYDRITERQQQLQQQFRIGFELIQLEQAADKGLSDETKINAVLQELGKLLTLEKNATHKYSLLLKILRAAVLTPTPSRNLAPYLDYLEESLHQLLIYHPESKGRVLTILAQYKLQAGREKRLQWLDEAEKEARLHELHDERPALRFVRCQIEADYGDLDAALRCLNEVEHLIYKASSRSLAARNNWIKLSELRTLIFTLKALKQEEIQADQLNHMRQLAEDMGRHRHEISIMLQEWKGLQHFINKDYEDAIPCFEKAKSHRKKQQDHPWYLMNKFFCSLLGKSRKKEDTAGLALLLQEMKEPFYSSVCGAIMKEAYAQSKTVSGIK